MEEDTIFPILPSDETILGKYRSSQRRLRMETICILTNLRLLVRWREAFCCCLHQSAYSSIALKSIQRIDETRPSRYRLVTYVILLLAGLATVIVGAVQKLWYVWVPGILMLAVTFILLIVYCLHLRKKFLTLTGTFGSITLRFNKPIAREFEAKLHETIYMSQAKRQESPKAPYTITENQAMYY